MGIVAVLAFLAASLRSWAIYLDRERPSSSAPQAADTSRRSTIYDEAATLQSCQSRDLIGHARPIGSFRQQLAGLGRDDVGQILGRATIVEAVEGDVILRTDEKEGALLVVLSGAIELRGAEDETLRLGRNDVLGEFMDVPLHPKTSAVVVAPTRFLVVSTRSLGRVHGRYPELAAQLTANVGSIMAI